MQLTDCFSCKDRKQALIKSWFVLILRGLYVWIWRQSSSSRLYEKAAFFQEFDKHSLYDQSCDFLIVEYNFLNMRKYLRSRSVLALIDLTMLPITFPLLTFGYSSFSFSIFSPNFILFSNNNSVATVTVIYDPSGEHHSCPHSDVFDDHRYWNTISINKVYEFKYNIFIVTLGLFKFR